MAFAVPDEASNESTGEEGDSEHSTHDGLDAGLIGYNDFDGDGDDPLSQLRKNPTVRNLVTVTFTRSEFMERLGECGLSDPTGTYRMFGAEMDVDGLGALKPVDAALDLRDSRFSPAGSRRSPSFLTPRSTMIRRNCLAAATCQGCPSNVWICCSARLANSIGLRRTPIWNRWPKRSRPWTSSMPSPT